MINFCGALLLQKVFSVKSYKKFLTKQESHGLNFLFRQIFKVKVPPRIAYFACVAERG